MCKSVCSKTVANEHRFTDKRGTTGATGWGRSSSIPSSPSFMTGYENIQKPLQLCTSFNHFRTRCPCIGRDSTPTASWTSWRTRSSKRSHPVSASSCESLYALSNTLAKDERPKTSMCTTTPTHLNLRFPIRLLNPPFALERKLCVLKQMFAFRRKKLVN